MNKYNTYCYYIRNLSLFLIFINIVVRYKKAPIVMFICIGGLLCLLINDFLRYYGVYKSYVQNRISLTLSLVASALLMFFIGGYTDFYFFSLLYEIIVFYIGNGLKFLLSLHVFFYLMGWFIKYDFSIIIRKFSMNFLLSTALYCTFVFLFFSIKAQIREKLEIKKLNKKLQEKNSALKDYSVKIEELAKSKERNRVAQEIHDSLGHSITALIMHLDFLEKVINKDNEKVKKIVVKAQSLARESMNNLRKAVYTLKEDCTSKGLISSINDIIKNISCNNEIDIEFRFSDSIEDITPELKNIIFRIIQEGLTNSIKHGNAKKIRISILKSSDNIKVVIDDNGRGCNNIVKGNGLMGIDEKIRNLKGEVSYVSKDKGFKIEILIPLSEDLATNC